MISLFDYNNIQIHLYGISHYSILYIEAILSSAKTQINCFQQFNEL